MNPGRTGRRVFNIDLKNKVTELEVDDIATFSVEVEYLIAFFFTLLFNRGFKPYDAKKYIEEVVNNGIR